MEEPKEIEKTEDLSKDKKEHKRSAAYPSINLQEAYDLAVKVNTKYGSVSVTRAEIADALGVHENTSSRDVAACVHYGLLSKSISDGYKLTELFFDILRPESEKDRKLSLIKAFGTPKLFQELISKFDNQTIPQEIANTLIKHHGITENASKSAADIFIESGEYAGVIRENRLLRYNVTIGTTSKTQYAEIITEESSTKSSQDSQNIPIISTANAYEANTENKQVPIYLTKNKTALFVYPNDITEKDIKLIEMAIQQLLLRIQLEKEDD